MWHNGREYYEFALNSTEHGHGLDAIAAARGIRDSNTILRLHNGMPEEIPSKNGVKNEIGFDWIFLAPVQSTPPVSTGFDGQLTVIASDGVNIRDQASSAGNVLVADKNTKGATYSYRTNSVKRDVSHGRVYVEVLLHQAVNGHTTGWLPVSGPKYLADITSETEYWVSPQIKPQ